MTVRKRTWRDKQGRQQTSWMIHIEHTWPDGRKQTIRKVSPAQTTRHSTSDKPGPAAATPPSKRCRAASWRSLAWSPQSGPPP